MAKVGTNFLFLGVFLISDPQPPILENVPNFRFRPVHSITSLFLCGFSPNLSCTQPFPNLLWKCTWFQVQTCPKYNFLISLQIFAKFDPNLTLCQLISKMYLISGSNLSKVKLPYSSVDFHQIRHQPYPLPTDFEIVPNFRFRPVRCKTSLILHRFSPNSTPTLPFTNWF